MKTSGSCKPIQKKFARAHAVRRAFFEYLRYNGIKVSGNAKLYSSILEDIVSEMTEGQIRRGALIFLDSADITEKERRELIKLAFQ